MIEGDSMESMVLELQREAYQQQTSASILLRKAYALSRKLKVEEFSKWAEHELNGYKDDEEVPEYRIVFGEIKAFNPYRGFIPAYFDKEFQEKLSKRSIFAPITEIELMIKKAEENNETLYMKFSSELQKKLEFEISNHIQAFQLSTILDKIRNIILDWTLKLEEQGVLGEGMAFSEKEKEKAVSTTSIINYIGTMLNSQVQQNTENSEQNIGVNEFKVENLHTLISDLKLLQDEMTDTLMKQELASEVEVLESQVKSPKPKNGIIRETLASVRNIAEGTTGSLLATTIQSNITMLLSNLL